MGRSLRGAGAPLHAPPFQQRNKTAAICRFVSNSLRPWGGESRERCICEDSNERQRPAGAADSPGSWPPSPPSQPRRLLRQREGRDNENNAGALGTIPLVRGGPTGHRAWASGHSLPPCGTPRHLTGPTSRRRPPGVSRLPGSAWALPTTQTSCDGQLGDHPDLRMNPSSAP